MTKDAETITILNEYEKINTYFNNMHFKKALKKRTRVSIEYFLKANPTIDLNTYFTDFRLLQGLELITKQDQTTIAIKNLVTYLEKKKLAPNTITGYLSDVKQLHDYYHMNIEDTDWKQIHKMQTHTGKVFQTTAPTKQQMQRILANANALEKAYFLTILTSGKRPEEILNIELDDLHLEEKPPRICIRARNTSTKRRTPHAFITEECKDAIQTYLTQRPMFIERITNSHLPKEKLSPESRERLKNSTKLFCIDERTIRRHWNILLKKADLNETTKNNDIIRHKYNHYSLRHYFRTYLSNRDLAEHLMGHTDISNLYNNKQEGEVAQDYLTFSKNLYIYSTQNIDEKLKKDLADKDDKILRLTIADENRKQEFIKMEDKLNKLMNRLNISEINGEYYEYDEQFQMYDPLTTNPDVPALDKNKQPLKRKLIARKATQK